MIDKRIGSLEVTTYRDSECVILRYLCNSAVSQEIQLRSTVDLLDLRYALECVLNERSPERRGEKP